MKWVARTHDVLSQGKNLVISISAILVLSCGQTDTHTDTQTDMDECYTAATLIGMSKYRYNIGLMCIYADYN